MSLQRGQSLYALIMAEPALQRRLGLMCVDSGDVLGDPSLVNTLKPASCALLVGARLSGYVHVLRLSISVTLAM